jgi:molybdate transport system substrate-binding protein
VGPLPAGAQKVTEFSAGIGARSRSPEAARELIRYFRSAAAAPVIAKAGLEPIPE